MKRTFKLFCVFIIALLCIFGATLCGCSYENKPTFVEGSLKCQIDEQPSIYGRYTISGSYRVNVKEEGIYYAAILVEYGDNRKVVKEEFRVDKVTSESVYNEFSQYIYAPDLKSSDVNVSFMDVWKDGEYGDDTPYFILAIACGSVAAVAVAAGIVLAVLSKLKKRAKAAECVAEEQSDVAADELPADGQNTEE